MEHPLANWKNYLTEHDYEYLIHYVDNIRDNKPNDKMIVLLGPERTGKSKLIKEIALCIGIHNFTICDTNGSAFLEPIVKLVHIVAIEDYKKRYLQQLKNIIEYKQSVIAETNIFSNNLKQLEKHIRIIGMDHQF